MNEEFSLRVRFAAVAAWWTVIIAAILVTVQWVGYLTVMSFKPGWVLAVLGPNVGWDGAQHILLLLAVLMRAILIITLMAAVWLSLWARRLRHR